MDKSYLDLKSLYFSNMFGSGVYRLLKQDEGEKTYLVNVLTGEEYRAQRVSCNNIKRKLYERHIHNPPNTEWIEWPEDMISLNANQLEFCTDQLENTYEDHDDTFKYIHRNRLTYQVNEVGYRHYILLFPIRMYNNYVSVEERYGDICDRLEKEEMILIQKGQTELGSTVYWKDSQILDLAEKILMAVDVLNRAGYIYEDIHLSKMLFSSQGDILLEYSNLIFPLSYGDTSKPTFEEESLMPYSMEFPLEFSDPAVVHKKIYTYDFNSQNYSLTALLFYLFFHRYPYDGNLLSGYPDYDKSSHYRKFREYIKRPIFIFDEKNETNRIGLFNEEKGVIQSWEMIPEYMKELFIKTLSEENAFRNNPDYGNIPNPSPVTWIKCLRRLRNEIQSERSGNNGDS